MEKTDDQINEMTELAAGQREENPQKDGLIISAG